MIKALIYPLGAEVTNPMPKSTRELKVMNEATLGGDSGIAVSEWSTLSMKWAPIINSSN